MKRRDGFFMILFLLILACNLPEQFRNPFPENPATPFPTATSIPKPIDLTHRPLYWFGPLPPQPTGPYDGSDDYMDLFQPGAPWDLAASHLQVFALMGGGINSDSTFGQLRETLQAIRQRGLALAIFVSPLNPGEADCGLYIEGFAGEAGLATIKRVKAAGGQINLIAFDEPYYYGHFYDGDKACHWSAEKIAGDLNSFITQARAVFPDVIIGDIEPVTGPANAQVYKSWLETFRTVNGYDLAFLHLDIDWSNTNWPQEVKAMDEYGNQLNIPIGLIFTGNYQDQTDEAWLSISGERIKRYEASGANVDHIFFTSWHDKPDRALPDSDPYTYTGFIKAYFEDHSSIGFQSINSDNLALGKSVQVSHQMAGNEGQWAVDGDLGTIWNAGEGPPQWIEIDLGAPYDVREVRLSISQYPAGQTVHRLLAKAPGGDFSILHTFEANTTDSELLVFTPPEPLRGIQFVRIETSLNPSWVSWREIEILR